ncbi:MAG: DUF4810 domain-containing protein [Candidatus Aureabacteria bacterium]|nr:DUF4810 domain-containing protein [Candidatus Auribacterota bacterium]
MKRGFFLFFILSYFVFSGCASQMYAWKNYESSLYKYYKDPTQKEKFIKNLEKIIKKSERKGKVPPGIYAEYGYMLYESQRYPDAIVYFQKEKNLWPESQCFMNKMIENAERMMDNTFAVVVEE